MGFYANESGKPHHHHILIVDDSPFNLRVLSDYLEDYGFKVQIAQDGEIALKSVRNKRPDLILLDIRMPGMDGFEVCSRLKADEALRDIPVIFMTAIEETEQKIKGYKLGAVDYITKPFHIAEVMARVNIHIRLQDLAERLEHKVRERTEELGKANQKLQEEIAEHRRAREALQENEQRMRLAIEGTNQGLWEWDMASGSIYLDDNWLRVLGYEPGKRAYDFEWLKTRLNREDKPVFQKALADYLEGRSKYYELEYRIRASSGDWRWIWARGACVAWDEQGKPLRMIGMHQDITRSKAMEEALEEAHQRISRQHQELLSIFDGVKGAVYVTDMLTSQILYANKYVEDIHGSVVGSVCWEVFQQGQLGPCSFCTNHQLLDSDGSPREPFVWEIQNTKLGVWYQCIDRAIPWPDGRMVRMEVAFDITERKRIEYALRHSEEQLRVLMDRSPIALATANERWEIDYINGKFIELFGYSHEEIPSADEWYIRAYPDEAYRKEVKELWTRMVASARETGAPIPPAVFRMTCKDRSVRDVEIHASVINGALFALLLDITEQKRAEDGIKAALAEKEVLLREIHHRVKNNLATIISLAQMQVRYVNDDRVARAFDDFQRRIRAMVLVHEDLYRSKDLSSIHAPTYMKELARDILYTYPQHGIDLKMEIDPYDLDIDTTIPCGLILTELITNSLKHAFPEGARYEKNREILVRFTLSDDTYVLTVSDNGTGFPPGFDVARSNSLGMLLVGIMASHQLRGHLDVSSKNGSTITASFPRKKKSSEQ